MICHLRKKRKKKNRKKEEKEKGLRSLPGGGGLSRFCRRKLCPEGFIFDEQTAQPPDLDEPSETGYLCGLFVFGWRIINISCPDNYKMSYLCALSIKTRTKTNRNNTNNLIMKSLIFTISTMCIPLFVSSCKNEISSDCKRLGLNTTVKSVQVKTYEAESKFGEIVRGDLDRDGNYLASFDEEGNLTSITDFDDDGELDSKTVFAYDDRNRLITYTQYYWNDLVSSFEYVYDENYLVKLNQKLFKNVLTEYKRNGEQILEYKKFVDGEIEEMAKYLESSSTRASYIVYDNEGKELRTVQEEYDKEGRLLKQIKNTGAKIDTTIWIYNKTGYLTEVSMTEHKYKGEIKYNDKNLPIYIKGGDLYHNTEVVLTFWNKNKVYYLEYEYDDKGNWIKQIVYEGEMKKPYTISDRSIVY